MPSVANASLPYLGVDAQLVARAEDPSLEMMRRAKERLGIETVAGFAEAIPFGPSEFDFVSMGYALRHLSDLSVTFREFFRVLRPGGRVCVLEITRPRSKLRRAAMKASSP